MLIYAHWDMHNSRTVQGFSTLEHAKTFVMKQIAILLTNNYYEVKPELYKTVEEKLSSIKDDKEITLTKMQELINAYNAYSKHVLKIEMPIHSIEEVAVVQ
jgi:hypothetical protein